MSDSQPEERVSLYSCGADRGATAISEGRLHSMDALRGSAILLVVLGHSGISLLRNPLPGVPWLVSDRSASLWIDFLLGWIRTFCIPLFMALAGFFAARSVQYLGPGGFLRSRGSRILLPLLLGSIVLLPVTFYVWSLGWFVSGRCTWNHIRRVVFDPCMQAELYGFAHLWFLEYLFLYSLVYAGICRLFGDRLHRMLARARRLPSMLLLLLLAIPAGLLHVLNPSLLYEAHNSFIPFPPRFVYHALFFAFGIVLHQVPECLEGWMRQRWHYLLASQGSYLCLWCIFPGYLQLSNGGLTTWAFAAVAALFAVLSIPTWFGVFQFLSQSTVTRMRPLTDASYWIYLVHFPIVGLLQIGCSLIRLPAVVKLAVVAGISIAVCLASYSLLARNPAIAAYLSGRKPQSQPQDPVSILKCDHAQRLPAESSSVAEGI